jgi:hypothetical protein
MPGPGQGDHPLFNGQTYRVLSRQIPDYRQTGRISGKISSQSEPELLGTDAEFMTYTLKATVAIECRVLDR